MGPIGVLCDAVWRPDCKLSELNLCRNRVRSTGCLVLVDALTSNTSLRRIVLNGNQIGKIGAMAIVKLSIQDQADGADGAGDEDGGREISIEDCTVDVEEQASLGQTPFDPTDPAGVYRLDMALPHSRTVLRNLVRLVLEEKGHFTAVSKDGQPSQIQASVEFVAPTEGVLSFSFASTRKPPATADDKTFRVSCSLFLSLGHPSLLLQTMMLDADNASGEIRSCGVRCWTRRCRRSGGECC
eukprot:2425947-Rhodomonas_salina.1